MKKHIIFAMSAVLALSFTSCKDEETVEVGQWNSSSDYAVVYFEESSKAVELDPAAETTDTLIMRRRNPELSDIIDAEEERVNKLLDEEKKTADKKLENPDLTEEQIAAIQKEYEDACKPIKEAFDKFVESNCKQYLQPIEVPITITSGDDNIISISSAKFEEGQWEGKYVVTFPKAEIGTTYEVQYAVTDTRFASYYSEAATATFSVTRVKWISIGEATVIDNWVWEATATREIFMKDGDPTSFRIYKPFEGMSPAVGEQSEWLVLNVLKPGEELGGVKISQNNLVYFSKTNSGYYHSDYSAYIWCLHPADRWTDCTEADYLHNLVTAYQKKDVDGKTYTIPAQIQLAPAFYMYGVGGWNYTQDDNIMMINFPGYVPTYEANLFTEGDFEWEDLYTGEFTSQQLGTVENVTLYKGKCVATQDDADKAFTEAYGTPYVLEAPYAEGYDLYFFVKDGRIQMPKDYDEDLGLQPIGIEAAGLPVYVSINGSSSSFSDNIVKLNLTFQALRKYRDENGRTQYEYITLDTKDEILANITWSEFATGMFTYDFFSPNDDGSPFTDPEAYVLMKRDDVDNMYKIPDWGMGIEFSFTWDQATNACSVANQFTKYSHPTYGDVFMIEGKAYSASEFGEHTSFYDPATKTFHFFPAYYVEAGSFGQTEEIFEITGDGAGIKHKATRFLRNNLTPLKVETTLAPFFNVKKLAKPASRKSGKKEFSAELF